MTYSHAARGTRSGGADTTLTSNRSRFARVALRIHMERALGSHRLLLSSSVAAAAASLGVPAQKFVMLSGPTSAPGYRYHELTGTFAATQHLERQTPVPFPSIDLGRYCRSPPSATLAPFAVPRSGGFPSVGIAVQLFSIWCASKRPAGLGDGRWTFSVDLNTLFWGHLVAGSGGR